MRRKEGEETLPLRENVLRAPIVSSNENEVAQTDDRAVVSEVTTDAGTRVSDDKVMTGAIVMTWC